MNIQRLRDYALWYYFRYYPSKARLKQKMSEKATGEDVARVFTDIEHLLSEKLIIETKIAGYLRKGRNFRYIRGSLKQKQFDSELVEECLKNHEGASLISGEKMLELIEKLQRKGKSLKMIKQKLCENSLDTEQFEEIVQKNNIQDDVALTIIIEKYKRKYTEKKLIQKLMQDGFIYAEVLAKLRKID